VHGIDLNQPYRLLPQIMKKWFSIGATRFKPNYDLLKTMPGRKLTSFSPKFFELPSRVPEKKRGSFLPVRTPEVSNMEPFPYVHSRNHRPRVDSLPLLSSITSHGYTPLLVFANQLTTGLNQDEYSLFHLTAGLTQT